MFTDLENLPEQFNAASIFIDENIRDKRGDNIAIYYGDEILTYHDVLNKVNKTGNALKNLGVNVEERVMLLLLDSPEFVASFFGAMKIGAVPIPINTMLNSKDFQYYLNDSGAKTLIVQSILLEEIEKIKDDLKYLKNIIVVGSAETKYRSFDEFIKNESSDLEAAETNKDDAAFWLYSSGSTGSPKGVVHLHHDMLYSSDLYAKNVIGITEKDITYSVAKLFFAYGLGNSLYFPFRVGASVVLFPDKPDTDTVFHIIEKYKPSLFYGLGTKLSNL